MLEIKIEKRINLKSLLIFLNIYLNLLLIKYIKEIINL